MIDEGSPYTPGNSFRAKAEAQQRRFRSQVLKLGYGEHAHWLTKEDAVWSQYSAAAQVLR